MNVKTLAAIAGALPLLTLAACSPSSTPGTTPPPPPSSALPLDPPAPPAPDITVSCEIVDTHDPSAPPGDALAPEVTITTNDLVTATEIDVSVITLNAGGLQASTATIAFAGPFAPGQTFQRYSTSDVASTNASCVAADVTGPVAGEFTYHNDSPAS